ncbi:MAG: L-serine ammonia-lyase, partial [Caulobacter sp.]|nr:L-serine ammonia-lyase [Caulobacter sp.]
MTASVFDLFKLGVGPSSSHTMGPMTAAGLFVGQLRDAGRLADVARVETRLYASLALTGRGHATDRAVILGLMGFVPAELDPDAGEAALLETKAAQSLKLGGQIDIVFDEARDIVWAGHERLPQHPNGLTFTAFDAAGVVLAERTYFSIGGGFVRDESEMGRNTPPDDGPLVPHPFESGA